METFTCARCGRSYPIRKDYLLRRKTDLCKSCLTTDRNKTAEAREISRQVGLLHPSAATKEKSSRSRKAFYQRNGTACISGDKNPAWIGGAVINKQGYRLIRTPGHPRASKRGAYVFEHILVVEKALGRYLTENEVVHHVNRNRLDNQIENLRVMTPAEHIRLHKLEGWWEMHVGMLWYSNEKESLKVRIEKAVDYYRRKYHQEPNLCLVHPDMFDAQLTQIGALNIRAYRPVLPGHLWIGMETKE